MSVLPEDTASGTPFSKGVNFTKWFESRNFTDIDFSKYNEKDFEDVKSLGADVVRLPVAFHNFLNSEKMIEPALLNYLDTVVEWARKHQIFLILDNHSFHPVNATDDNIDKILIPVWEQLAKHFKESGSYLIYEILNEPHIIADERWNEIQGAAIEAIRKIDRDRLIIIGGTNYNSIDKMLKVPVYPDSKLIYTFHFYDPHIFTHQGATWNKPSLAPLSNLPFPVKDDFTCPVHETFKGTWVEESLKYYRTDSKLEKLRGSLDKVCAFAKDNNVPVYCGEFGVFMIQSPAQDRVFWYKFFCDELAKRNIPWTCWDYFGGFGIFKTMQRGGFPSDLNMEIVKAMGFNA
ncbi:MAG: glycoside hydrolase family 5 protein [Treponema sp.]|nr:glycoside hydrolase family 5 protein [Treponema sp.]